MTIIVGFSRNKEWYKVGSVAIELAEKRPYSHAFLQFTDPFTQRDMIAQAAHGMVNEMSFTRFTEENTVVRTYSFEITPDQFHQLLQTIQDNLGMPYGYLELIWIAIKKLLRIQVNIHDHNDTYICSEFVGMLLQTLDILKPDNLDFLTPSDLEKLILQKINK